MVDERLATSITADANDFVYQWEASHDYDPSAGLEKIEATLLRSMPPTTSATRRRPASPRPR